MQPLLRFLDRGGDKCDPCNVFGAPGPINATPIAFWTPGDRNLQPLLRFAPPGGQQCNPYNSFGGPPLGLFFGTPTTGSGSGAAKM